MKRTKGKEACIEERDEERKEGKKEVPNVEERKRMNYPQLPPSNEAVRGCPTLSKRVVI